MLSEFKKQLRDVVVLSKRKWLQRQINRY